jgi:hypothetical protein
MTFLVNMLNTQLFDTLYRHATECAYRLTDGKITKTFGNEEKAKFVLDALKENRNNKVLSITEKENGLCDVTDKDGKVIIPDIKTETACAFLDNPDLIWNEEAYPEEKRADIYKFLKQDKDDSRFAIEERRETEDYCIINKVSSEQLLKHLSLQQAQYVLALPEKFKIETGKVGALPIHVRFVLDEFANTGEIPGYQEKLATMRRFNISSTIILQSLAQLKAMYKDTYEAIIGNCDTMIFLGSTELSTTEYLSKRLGEKVVKQAAHSSNMSSSSGKTNRSMGENISVQKHRLWKLQK